MELEEEKDESDVEREEVSFEIFEPIPREDFLFGMCLVVALSRFCEWAVEEGEEHESACLVIESAFIMIDCFRQENFVRSIANPTEGE
jgi:hypothetical protein